MLSTTLNQIRLNEHLREYDRDMERAERIRDAEELYWEFRGTFEDELENENEIEEFYEILDGLGRILSEVRAGESTIKDMVEFLLDGDNPFRLPHRLVMSYVD